MSSVNLKALPYITFAPQSTSEVEKAVITAYEKIAGITLQPADPVRLFLESLAYIVSIQNGLIDLAGKQNLLAYATGAHLDHLGALMGVSRIPARNATCIIRFSINEKLGFDIPVPEATRVSTQDGKTIFVAMSSGVIEKGNLYCDIVAQCNVPGAQATGLIPGQVNRLIDPIPYIVSVENTTTTTDGSDIEDDERLRERIRIAPESYTVAGSRGEYEARTLEVSSDISAVSVYSPEPGVVDVRFVLDDGVLPDAAMVQMVKDHLSGETIRPLTDTVLVGAPNVVEYDIEGYWYVNRQDVTLLAGISAAVEKALNDYIYWQKIKPARDIIPTHLIHLVQQAGAKRIALTKPVFRELSYIEIARERNVNLLFGGVEDE